jgi:hypothetical protein
MGSGNGLRPVGNARGLPERGGKLASAFRRERFRFCGCCGSLCLSEKLAEQRAIGPNSASFTIPSINGTPFHVWKERSLAEAQRIRESKSRAVRPLGNLPKWIARQVTILRIDTRSLEQDKKASSNAASPAWPLYQAVRRTPGRKALLLGDLGTGKSTLLCDFVEQTLTEVPEVLAFIVPVFADPERANHTN